MKEVKRVIDEIINENNFIIFYNLRDTEIEHFYSKLISQLAITYRLLIIDLEHRITLNAKSNAKIIRVNNKEEQIDIFTDLDSYIHPKLELIVVLGLPVFLGDFIGRKSSDYLYNQRILAYCLSMLKELSTKVKVVVKHFEQGYNKAQSQYPRLIRYYSDTIVRISKTKENLTFDLAN